MQLIEVPPFLTPPINPYVPSSIQHNANIGENSIRNIQRGISKPQAESLRNMHFLQAPFYLTYKQ